MENIKIYFLDNSEIAEFEASSRGYRSDVFVKINHGNIFHLHVYDIVRLRQDFETEVDSYGFFDIDSNIILVKEVVVDNIKLTIERLFKQKFFDRIKPINENEIDVTHLKAI